MNYVLCFSSASDRNYWLVDIYGNGWSSCVLQKVMYPKKLLFCSLKQTQLQIVGNEVTENKLNALPRKNKSNQC